VSSTADWPTSWQGTWVSADGKAVTIEFDSQVAMVTVRPGVGLPAYGSAPLLDGGTKAMEQLVAACHLDERGLYLDIEAGTPELGPTYRLYAAIESPTGWCAAPSDVRVDQIVLLPATMIGLYDDYEDDLGVPWAYPLTPLRRQAAMEPRFTANQPPVAR